MIKYRILQLMNNCVVVAVLDSTFVVSIGIFRQTEVLSVNIFTGIVSIFTFIYFGTRGYLSYVLTTTIAIAFNIVDSLRISQKEYSGFSRIIAVKKKNTYLSKFVDRLLPKHVNSSCY